MNAGTWFELTEEQKDKAIDLEKEWDVSPRQAEEMVFNEKEELTEEEDTCRTKWFVFEMKDGGLYDSLRFANAASAKAEAAKMGNVSKVRQV